MRLRLENFRGNLCKVYQNLNELWQIASNFGQNVELAFWAIGNFNYEFKYGVFIRLNLGKICNFWNRVKLDKTHFWNFNETYCGSDTVKFLIATLQFFWLIEIFFFQDRWPDYGRLSPLVDYVLVFVDPLQAGDLKNGRLSPIWYQRNSRSRHWYIVDREWSLHLGVT